MMQVRYQEIDDHITPDKQTLTFVIEYDDYYGAYDDDDDDDGDFDGQAFEAQYLSTGIDLNINQSSSNTSNLEKQRRELIEGIGHIDKLSNQQAATESETSDHDHRGPDLSDDKTIESVSSDLTLLAIQHLDKNQWQLPLMEMDKKFRDRTYYKHYTDTYISSLSSKLGQFLADDQLSSNPMRYHVQQELDNYSKYSRMFELLTEYYQSIASGFFSFATPSPDEEIVIGCRLGTKGYYQVRTIILEPNLSARGPVVKS